MEEGDMGQSEVEMGRDSRNDMEKEKKKKNSLITSFVVTLKLYDTCVHSMRKTDRCLCKKQ